MEKYLIVDIGNSVISVALFTNGKIEHRLDVKSDETHVAHIDEFLSSFVKDKKIKVKDVKDGLICSVVPQYSSSLKKAIKKVFGVSVSAMDSSFYEDVKMIVDDPKQVGGDIVADVVAAKEMFGGPLVVVDLGTISKNIILDENNVFVGVSFFPGIQVCFNAMRSSTALLPGTELKRKPTKLVGNNTLEALESGVFYGTLNGIKSYVKEIESNFSRPIKKILTGGNSTLFAKELPDFIYDPDFVLKGIYILFKNKRG